MYEKVRSVLEKHSNGVKITPDTNLTNDLALDSIDRAEIGVELEDLLELPDGVILHEDMMAARTVGNLVSLMERYVLLKNRAKKDSNGKNVLLKMNYAQFQTPTSAICSLTGQNCHKTTHLQAVDNHLDFCNIVNCSVLKNFMQKTK